MCNVCDGFSLNGYAGSELNLIRGVSAPKDWVSFSSFKGRTFCLIAIPLHLIGAGVKPVIYGLASLVTALCVAVSLVVQPILSMAAYLGKEKTPAMLATATKLFLNFSISAVFSPVLQVFLAVKALLGVIDPKMYFTNEEAFPEGDLFDDRFSIYPHPYTDYQFWGIGYNGWTCCA